MAVEAGPSLPRVLMIAETQSDAIAAAERLVSEARAKLRHAMASGKGLKDARAALADVAAAFRDWAALRLSIVLAELTVDILGPLYRIHDKNR